MTKSRRSFLCTLGAGIIAAPLGTLSCQGTALTSETPKLNPEDPSAKALDYVHQSPTTKRCGGCQLYRGSRSSEWGRCAIFSGRLVNTKGWCQSWSA